MIYFTLKLTHCEIIDDDVNGAIKNPVVYHIGGVLSDMKSENHFKNIVQVLQLLYCYKHTQACNKIRIDMIDGYALLCSI